jgi:hypothetical protein
MKVVLPEPGAPGKHLGISHAIKHYLNPAELWDDLADDIDANLRPMNVLRELKIPEPPPLHEKHLEPCAAMRAAWSKFGLVFSQAYGRIVSQYCDQMPPYAWKKWRPLDRLGIRHAAHLGSGILVVVSRSARHDVLRTAFRPSPATFVAPLPTNPEHRARRNIAFEKAARRKLNVWSDARFLAEIEIESSPSSAEGP